MKRIILLLCVMLGTTVACEERFQAPPIQAYTFDEAKTAFGFFPTPPEVTIKSVLNHYEDLGKYSDFVLLQHAVPWKDFVHAVDGDSQARTDIRNQMLLARQNGLGAIFVVDPLNGLNRTEFMELPQGWKASFANPDVRAAFINYTLWIVKEFRPRYLGLSSEINTYLETYPAEVSHYLTLYNEVYKRVKTEAPETKIFVTFQWENLNNLGVFAHNDYKAYETKWEQVEMFEPNLDIWAISTYPFVAFPSAADIPNNYYTPLLDRTSKPLAIAEGGFPSIAHGPFKGSEQSQIDYLDAANEQIGDRLAFWVYLLLNDLNLDSYSKAMGQNQTDFETLSYFAALGLRNVDGTDKSALDVWNDMRKQ